MSSHDDTVRQLRDLAAYHREHGDPDRAEHYERLAREIETFDRIDLSSPLVRLVRLCDALAGLGRTMIPDGTEGYTDNQLENLLYNVAYNAQRYITDAKPVTRDPYV